jgi:hypothetical protein
LKQLETTVPANYSVIGVNELNLGEGRDDAVFREYAQPAAILNSP